MCCVSLFTATLQVTAKSAEAIIEEAKLLKARLGGNFYVKIPISEKGLKATMQLKKIGMHIVQDQVWNRVTENRFNKIRVTEDSDGNPLPDEIVSAMAQKATRYYMDEFHLLLSCFFICNILIYRICNC